MLDKTISSVVRCPKCNETMRLVEEAPHFALFLSPSFSFRCDPCHLALSYPPDEDEPIRHFSAANKYDGA